VANNSGSNSSFIPMLTLGITSSGTTAILLGVLTLYNLTRALTCPDRAQISFGG
jgi:TctA family transporter